MSNTERQRQFRKRNPGYYGRLHARSRAAAKRGAAQLLAALQAKAANREPLALPAPAETIEIPGMNMIPTMSSLSAAPVSEHVTIPPVAAKSLAA